MTARVHGGEIARRVQEISEAVFSGSVSSLDPELRSLAAACLPSRTIARTSSGPTAAIVAVESGAAASAGEARRLIGQGGLYVEDERVRQPADVPALPADGLLFVRRGKRDYRVLRVVRPG